MDISIIIVNYNTSVFLMDAVNSLREKTKEVSYEIIVVDNDSRQDQKELLKPLEDFATVIYSDKNLGFGSANNLGAKRAKTDVLMFLNPDTLLINDAISILFKFLIAHSEAGTVGGDLFDGNNEPAFSYGNYPSLKQQFSEIGFNKLYKSYYLKYLAVGVANTGNELLTVDYISGADMLIRKQLFDRIGGFDENFFLYYEETDMAFRLKKAGYKHYLVPEAKITHLESVASKATHETFSINKYRFMEKSKYYFFKKCYGAVPAFFLRLFTLIEHVLKYLFLGFDKVYIEKFKVSYQS